MIFGELLVVFFILPLHSLEVELKHVFADPLPDRSAPSSGQRRFIRALLGHGEFRALLGAVAPPPPPSTIPVTNRRGGKFKRQWIALDEIFQIKFKNLTPGSPVTSHIRSNTKCLTFPFKAFSPQNVENKRISTKQPMNRHDSGQ